MAETMQQQKPSTQYFEDRAARELELAQIADDPRAVAVHYELACRYLDLANPGQEASKSIEMTQH